MTTLTAPSKYIGTVYLLHFDKPYKHARHYIGWAKDLDERLAQHLTGHGARLLEVVTSAGITWTLARTWKGTRNRERQLKRQGGASRRCPMCGVHPLPDLGERITTEQARIYRLREITNEYLDASPEQRALLDVERAALVAAEPPNTPKPFDPMAIMQKKGPWS